MRRLIRLSTIAAVIAASLAVGARPAAPGSGTSVTATGVALAESASCRYGDMDISYVAHGAQQQGLTFSAADGAVLDTFEAAAFAPDYEGTEHMLSEADAPPPPGTVVGVYASVGVTPPDALTTAEFFVLYRCSADKTVDGGVNTVLGTCAGTYGSCPRTAEEALRSTGDGVPPPSFTG